MPGIDVKNFGSNLHRIRVERGIRQKVIALDADTVPSTVANVESGRQNPSLSFALACSRTLGVSLDALFSDPTEQQE